MKKVLLLIVAVVALGATGLALATYLNPSYDLFELGWVQSNGDWEGVTYGVKVKETTEDQLYFLKATPADLMSEGPLSEVRMSVAGGPWTEGTFEEDDYASFLGTGEDMSTVMTAKCDDPHLETAAGWALISLYIDNGSVEDELDDEDDCIAAMHIHGVYPVE